ncbi:helix-turn-helix transcriptional regulator [Thalassolituus oleivorans]|uniref:helix-turn-helix transcriptional regulator n=1 Tax=Thalassolituus oleivorans TaxID=187493 RepID=UPI0023F32627|nr:helix-turn-helix transcriptional regulator [Thalassolituus oleivorans]
MSSNLAEKMKLLRDHMKLTREAFGSEIGVSGRSIETIENKNSTPRGDVLEKIARRWPQFSLWLLTGEVSPPNQIAPVMDDEIVIRICGSMVRPREEETIFMVRHEFLDEIIFLQCVDDVNKLVCIVVLKTDRIPYIKQAVIVSDNMHWCSDDSGMRGLVRFAEYLERVGRDDLIRSSLLMNIDEKFFDGIYKTYEINEKNLKYPDIDNSNESRKIWENFLKWKMEGKKYSPKYGWRDFQ